MSSFQLTVVLSTFGNYPILERVLDAYERVRDPAPSFEMIVVVDHADPEPERVRSLVEDRTYPARMLIGHRPGLSANRNTGWQASTSPLVMFTDNDTVPHPKILDEHLAWHQRWPEPEVAVLGHVRWAREVKVTPFMHWLDHGVQFDYPHIDGIEAGWGRFYGANISVKRELLDRVGGFEEERLPYLYEDLEWAYRASKHGLRVLYNRRAEVEHLREVDLDFWRGRLPRLARAERTFVEMYPEIPPYFQRMFSQAAAAPPARGRGRHLIRWIPERFPWLGRRVWASASMYYRQALAADFQEAWERAGAPEDEYRPADYLAEPSAGSRSASSDGRSSGGPK